MLMSSPPPKQNGDVVVERTFLQFDEHLMQKIDSETKKRTENESETFSTLFYKIFKNI